MHKTKSNNEKEIKFMAAATKVQFATGISFHVLNNDMESPST